MDQWTQAWYWRQTSDEYAYQGGDEEGAFTDSSPCLKRSVPEEHLRDADPGYKKYKGSSTPPMANPPPPDPTSHRIIEKRRRDRMNNCLVNLSHLVPSCHQRKGRGRIEKTEIIEQAIKHIRDLQGQLARLPEASGGSQKAAAAATVSSHYEEGYRECLREAMQWMVEHEGFIPGDPICARLMNHLHEHIELVLKGGFPPRPHHLSSGASSASGYTGSTSGYDGSTSSAAGTASSAAGSCSDGAGGRAQWSRSASNSASPPEVPQTQDLAPAAAPSLESSVSPTDRGATSRYPDSEPPQYDQARLYRLLHKTSEAKRAHPPSSSSSRSSEENARFMYKFKTSMKKRFSADMSDETGSKRCRRLPPPSADRKPAAATLAAAAAAAAAARSQQVPVFALHSRGPLYLPMTVHVEALGSQAELLTAEPHSVVHPVNISVCFCGGRPPPAPPASDEPPSTSGVSSLQAETVTSDELNSGS